MEHSSPSAVELDPTTAQLLRRLAKRWGVSKEEAIRRALEEVSSEEAIMTRLQRLDLLKHLQSRLNLTPAKAAEWQRMIGEIRR